MNLRKHSSRLARIFILAAIGLVQTVSAQETSKTRAKCSRYLRASVSAAAQAFVATRFDYDAALYVTKTFLRERSDLLPFFFFEAYLGIGRSKPSRISPLRDSKVGVWAVEAGGKEAIFYIRTNDNNPSEYPEPMAEIQIAHRVAYALWDFARINSDVSQGTESFWRRTKKGRICWLYFDAGSSETCGWEQKSTGLHQS